MRAGSAPLTGWTMGNYRNPPRTPFWKPMRRFSRALHLTGGLAFVIGCAACERGISGSDFETGHVLTSGWVGVSYPSEELIAVASLSGTDTLCGYSNLQGKLVVTPQFRGCSDFSGGLARVVDPASGRSRIIDKSGEVITTPHDSASHPRDGIAAIFRDGRVGYVGANGKLLVEPLLSWPSHFSEGLAPERINETFGYVKSDGRVAIPARFASAQPFSEGLASAAIRERITEYVKGSPPWCTRWCYSGGNVTRFQTLYGVIDTLGQWVVTPQFGWIDEFKDGFATVSQCPPDDCRERQRLGIINRDGRLIAPVKYRKVFPFENGQATLIDFNGGPPNNETVEVVDTLGRILRSFKFRPKSFYLNEGIFADLFFSSSIRDYYSLHTLGGDSLPGVFEDMYQFTEGFLAVSFNEKWGYINTLGQFVIPPTYLSAVPLKNGFAAVRREDGWAVIAIGNAVRTPARE